MHINTNFIAFVPPPPLTQPFLSCAYHLCNSRLRETDTGLEVPGKTSSGEV